MRPTQRGVAVVVIIVACVAMGAAFGARALNAIVGPAVIALGAAVLRLVWMETPTVERTDPPAGFPGERRTVELDVSGSGIAEISDTVREGPEADAPAVRTTLPDTVTYDLELQSRGELTLGPPTVVVSDVLGLLRHRVETDATGTVLIYPSIYDLRDEEAFAHLFDHTETPERQAFDRLREYAPGDPLRDVHWKSSAKRAEGELVVKEFVGETSDGTFTVAAGGTAAAADEMASAAASIALLGMEAGLSVAVECPDGTVPPGHGELHRRHVLEVLARTGPGSVSERARAEADVVIDAGADGVTVRVDGREHTLAMADRPQFGTADRHRGTVAADGGETR